LVVLQKKAIRILSGKQYFQIHGESYGPLPSADPLFKNLGLLKLNDIFKLSVANFVFETLIYESPQNFWNWFQYTNDIHTHSTKSSTVIVCSHYFDTGTAAPTFKLYTKKTNLAKYGERMIKVSGPLIWNNIPLDIQESDSIVTFKEKVKSFYIGQYGT
jgi:hypothetical protein